MRVCVRVRSPLGATRSTLTLSIFYESCCEDNKWAQIVANIGHLPHNKTEEACFNVEEGVNNSKITASFSLELRFVSADAAKNATPTNAVRLKASGDFTKRDKGDLERLHADGKVSSSKKKAKKKASGFGQIFHKKRNRSRAFGQQFPPDEPVVPEIITSTVEWLRQSASKTHGLFRESASTADMDMLRKQWESGTSFIHSFIHSFRRMICIEMVNNGEWRFGSAIARLLACCAASPPPLSCSMEEMMMMAAQTTADLPAWEIALKIAGPALIGGVVVMGGSLSVEIFGGIAGGVIRLRARGGRAPSRSQRTHATCRNAVIRWLGGVACVRVSVAPYRHLQSRLVSAWRSRPNQAPSSMSCCCRQ